MMIKYILYTLILLSCSLQLWADNSVIESKIEQLLIKNNYTIDNLLIPKERLIFYNNHYNEIEKYFNNPISGFTQINNIADYLNSASTLDQIKHGAQFITNRQISNLYLNTSLSTKIMNLELGTNLDSSFNFKSGMIIRPYLNLIINAQNIISKDIIQKDNQSNRYLKKITENIINLFDNQDSNYSYTDFDNRSSILNNSLIFDIAYNLYEQIIANNESIKSLDNEWKKEIKTTIINTKYGKIAIGGMGNDTYTGNFIAIIDLGGNDTYNLDIFDQQLAYYSPIRFIVDFDGNDKYNGKDYNLASGYFGVNFIIDYKGSDEYTANNYSIANAIFGVGIIEDYDGNDKYINNNFGIASSLYGIAILKDYQGDDYYQSSKYSQAFSSTKAYSLLIDKEGDDIYTYNNQGEYLQGVSIDNPTTGAGSIAILLDNLGNDKYNSVCKSQAYSAGNSIAILKDYDGNDKYQSYLFSQSSANKLSFSLLYDINGDDTYRQPFSTQSNAQYYSYSLLFDQSGNDYYLRTKYNPNYIYAALFIDDIGYDTLQYNNFYQINNANYTPSLSLIGLYSDSLNILNKLDTTSKEIIININQNITDPEYSKELKEAINKYITDTLLFQQIKEPINKLTPSDKMIFVYHYIKSAKNDNLMQSAITYLGNEFNTINHSLIAALMLNPAFTSEQLLSLLNSNIQMPYKKALAPMFATTNFQQNSKEFKKDILNLPYELKAKIYPFLANNNNKAVKKKIKELIKSEKDINLKQLLKNE